PHPVIPAPMSGIGKIPVTEILDPWLISLAALHNGLRDAFQRKPGQPQIVGPEVVRVSQASNQQSVLRETDRFRDLPGKRLLEGSGHKTTLCAVDNLPAWMSEDAVIDA